MPLHIEFNFRLCRDSLTLVGEVWTTLRSNFTSAGDIIQIPNLLPATYYRVRVQDYNELFGWSPSADAHRY